MASEIIRKESGLEDKRITLEAVENVTDVFFPMYVCMHVCMFVCIYLFIYLLAVNGVIHQLHII